MFSNVEKTIDKTSSFELSTERKLVLQPLIDFVQKKVDSNEEIRLNFICTHNSRRSHLGQIWAQTMAFHFGIQNVFCYSGGTEETAMFYKVGETLQNQGFEVLKLSNEENSVYAIKYAENELPVIGFSKKYDNNFNPKSGFAAIMTCSQADGGCPFIAGAEKRIPITYNDPKEFDNTELMNVNYEERSLEIASEMFYVFSNVKLK